MTASEVNANPGARINRGLSVLRARFDRERAATKRKNGEDAGFGLRQELVGGRAVGARLSRARAAVGHIHSVGDGCRPVRNGNVTGDDVRSGEGHDGANGTFRHTVKLASVGRAGGLVDKFRVEEFPEFTGNEFTGVIGVEGADDSDGSVGAKASVGVERRDETFNASRCF